MSVASILLAIGTIAVAAGCASDLESSLERLSQARLLSSDLLVQFTTSADAANRAVMADTDEVSASFAREAERAIQAAQHDIEVLGPVLTGLRYAEERSLLEQFRTQFAEYRTLNERILGLAVENSNLKAQGLSFGSSQEAADAFRDALEPIRASAAADIRWRVEALVATAVAAVREIQVVQAPHIAEADDAAMTRMETHMAVAEATARRAMETLVTAVPPASRPRLTPAVTALDRFMAVNTEILVLSRRNTDVRSLALSLGQKRMITATCEETLRTLQDALAKRGFGGTR